MKFTLGWLKQFLDTNAELNQIIEALNKIGHEVEEVHNPAEQLKDFVIAEVLSTEKHPNADKLKLCKVYDGKSELNIVCGAKNVAIGQKVVLAKPGTVIPANNMEIKLSKIRGVESHGMICAADELGLEDKSDGIMVLENSATPGMKLLDFMPALADPIIDLAITPNRADCLGVYGIARDLQAFGIGKLNLLPQINYTEKFNSPIEVVVAAQEKCPKFVSIYIKGITNIESPAWLKGYLIAVGCTPRNLVVDITNYINLSFARPLHVFDADKLTGSLVVRDSQEGEDFKALDGKEYKLKAGDTVVAAGQTVHALGGIIGGDQSKCELYTKNILLESAIWDPATIAKTAKKYCIDTDSKYRFERGVDYNFTELGIQIAANMIIEVCGGEASKIAICGTKFKEKNSIKFDHGLVQKISGTAVPTENTEIILEKLGFEFQGEDNKIIYVPTWRHDVKISEDLVEEVLRIYGYDSIEAKPIRKSLDYTSSMLSHKQSIALELPNIMATNGISEVVTWSFMSSHRAKVFGLEYDNFKISNPISDELDIIRSSIIPNLVGVIERNHHRSIHNLAIFEIGTVHFSVNPGDQAQYISGARSGNTSQRNIYKDTRPFDVFDIKRDVYNILAAFGYDEFNIVCSQDDSVPQFMHPARTAHVLVKGQSVGFFGELHPQLKQKLKLKQNIVCFELNLDKITPSSAHFQHSQISDYQSVERDFAFTLDNNIPAGDVITAVKKNCPPNLLRDICLFDVYEGENLPKGKKSIAFTITLQSSTKTLEQTEINHISEQIISLVEKEFNAMIRDS